MISRQAKNIFIKDFKLLVASPIIYIFLTIFLGVSNYFFFLSFFINGLTTLRGFFSLAPIILAITLPTLTMRSWSEELRSGTIEDLFTYPIKESDAILGKFLGVMAIVLIALAFSLLIPVTLLPFGVNFDIGRIFSGFLALILYSMCISIMGITISYTTKNQIVAYLLTLILTLVIYLLGIPDVLFDLPVFLRGVLEEISIGSHYSNVSKGLILLKDLVYFASFFIFFYSVHYFLLKNRS